MASIFTYETNPIRLASPWPPFGPAVAGEVPKSQAPSFNDHRVERVEDYKITKLDAEPQEGPVEYKLHLLLRPRRSFSATSTVQKVSGSHLSKSRTTEIQPDSGTVSGTSSTALATTSASRQNRLHHLTTQLLWRLQQSCHHHGTTRSDLVIPALPESNLQDSIMNGPAKLVGGLEESLGALYEIGVSDDGSFVGLLKEELDESMMVLRAMAYSLGCQIEILRVVDVGECQWHETSSGSAGEALRERVERLHVAEVLVSPSSNPNQQNLDVESANGKFVDDGRVLKVATADELSSGEQLRVSLTGSTTSGKSSLLGTLSTSTLDNGRGKSRLSLLKHRHEIVSGVTSSLAQELIGYQDSDDVHAQNSSAQVVNYASSQVSSWNDTHALSHPGRLVFVTDSAGHPRYRRTTVRGLMSWAPHWTLCCVAADEDDEGNGQVGATASAVDVLGSSGLGVDLSKAHLELCLKLELPLVVVITKLDLASKSGLRQKLAKVLTILKEAGRKPVILPNTSAPDFDSMSLLLQEDNQIAMRIFEPLEERRFIVPIVLTSAVTGAGISKVHALLRCLPLLKDSANFDPSNDQTTPLFHIDEVYLPPQYTNKSVSLGIGPTSDFILSGYLKHGIIAVGDSVVVGPAAFESSADVVDTSAMLRSSSYPGHHDHSPQPTHIRNGVHRALSGSLKPELTHPDASHASEDFWHTVIVTSIRYLRLPVRTLQTGQVATIGVTFANSHSQNPDVERATNVPTLRRGMVLCNWNADAGPSQPQPPAYISFAAIFKDANTYVIPGSSVTVYIASIRAAAKILEVKVPENETAAVDDVFAFDGEDVVSDQTIDPKLDVMGSQVDNSIPSLARQPGPAAIEITFQFVASREWIEVGTKVLVTPASGLSMVHPPGHGEGSGGGGGHTAFEAFVGEIVNAYT